MNPLKHPFLIAATAFVAGLILVAVSQAETVSRDRSAFDVSAHGETVAWSSYSRADERFVLVQRTGGQILGTEVKPSRQPFELDLGPSAIGGPLGVYSRCTTPPRFERRMPSDARYGCDIEGYDFTTATTFSVAGAGRRHCDEHAASAWRDRVAFARIPSTHRDACKKGLYVSDAAGGVRRIDGRVPSSTDVSGDMVAAAFIRTPRASERGPCCNTRSEIVLFNLATGSKQVIATGTINRNGKGPLLSDPVFDSANLYYLSNEGPRLSRVFGRAIAPGGTDTVTEPFRGDSIGVAGGRIYYTNQHGVFSIP